MRTVAEIKQELEQAKQAELAEMKRKREDYERLKNTTVKELCIEALSLSKSIKAFKSSAFDDMNTLHEILKDYSQRHALGKGSFRIQFEDFRVNYKKQGKPTFDERSIVAESHIKEFITKKFEGDKDTHDLINSLLERKNGDFDINLIQKLYNMESRFTDENWVKGIELLKESYNYEHSKDYITFEQRNSNGEWIAINLNFASI